MVQYIDQLENGSVRGKKAFVRVDFNVPLDDSGNITDDTRIRRVLPTINKLLDEGMVVVLASHMGRPKGTVVPKFSLAPVAKRLGRLLKKDVVFLSDCVGSIVAQTLAEALPGTVILLENLRFYPGESSNDPDFAKALARGIDIYVNDAFATAHRSHASVVGIVAHVPRCYAGFLMKEELNYFHRALENPMRPVVAIIGGAKVSSKLGALENLINRVDKVIVGGAMAFTFLKSMGFGLGESLVEADMVDQAREIFKKAIAKGVRFYLPVDCVAGDRMAPDADTRVLPVQEIPKKWMGLDIGPATTTLFNEVIQDAKTIIWNGPMGAFELDAFSRGTLAMVHNVANTYALTIVGGGDTDVAVHKAGEVDRISYISTGGGAFLELLEGKKLPAIAALEQSCGS
ncbi:MAG: phosphoglycerate kinase [Deltaproteobacteria bacterium]|nr:phosphoglycerate kinase [Candidatus Anaeroferrophillus wilburensis]MBN2888106.1 phosphoglycerate kinase [Deltaproteobacteria bacterium]